MAVFAREWGRGSSPQELKINKPAGEGRIGSPKQRAWRGKGLQQRLMGCILCWRVGEELFPMQTVNEQAYNCK
jgi:hypothetical protein